MVQSIYLKVLRGEPVDRVPVWFMRQAGRYLPEYRELRKRHRMLELITTPELAAQVTLQPLERFELDAAIIFADILNPLIGMGVKLDFVEGEGPKIFNPISSPQDVDRLIVPDVNSVAYTLEAIKICVSSLCKKNLPLIGFAGAPFTLSSYMIEKGRHSALADTKRFMITHHSAWHDMQQKLVAMVSSYLIAQAAAGASVLQIFDSWSGMLAEAEFKKFVLPYLKLIIERVKAAVQVPLIYFSTGTGALLHLIKELHTDGVSVDWRVPIRTARNVLGQSVALQGNLDPQILNGPLEYLEPAAKAVLEEGSGCGRFIFNLGHGILPDTPVQNVARVVELVRQFKT